MKKFFGSLLITLTVLGAFGLTNVANARTEDPNGKNGGCKNCTTPNLVKITCSGAGYHCVAIECTNGTCGVE
ncbi:MAG: hypothetical protein JNK18_15485 [Cyclobacteriaceae bacterium]|nr:hypothetical protein [Cyclobacteriaceae bacterium]